MDYEKILKDILALLRDIFCTVLGFVMFKRIYDL